MHVRIYNLKTADSSWDEMNYMIQLQKATFLYVGPFLTIYLGGGGGGGGGGGKVPFL